MEVKPESLLNESDEVLKSIYKVFNEWGWPEILGDKPDGWDLMPNYRKPWMDENMKTRNDIIRPYMDVIKTRIDHWDVYPIKGRVKA